MHPFLSLDLDTTWHDMTLAGVLFDFYTHVSCACLLFFFEMSCPICLDGRVSLVMAEAGHVRGLDIWSIGLLYPLV